MKTIKAELIPQLYHQTTCALIALGATGKYVLTGSGVYVGIMGKLTEQEHPIHDLDLKLIPDNPLIAAKVLTALSLTHGKATPLDKIEYFPIKGEPARFDFMYQGIPVNVFLALDPVNYNTNNVDEIPIENLDDIFLAKAKMNRPKDVEDINTLGWMEYDCDCDDNYEDIIHPYVLDEVKPLTDAELMSVFHADVVEGYYNTKSIRFTNRMFYNGSEVPHFTYQYIDMDTYWEDYDKVRLGEIEPKSIRIAVYKRMGTQFDIKYRTRIEF